MIPWPSQVQCAKEAYDVLRQYGLVYIAGEERTGKLLASIVTAELCSNVTNVLVLTTKKAIEGWYDTLSKYSATVNIEPHTYHSAHKAEGQYDLVILDECHNYLSAFPKAGGIWRKVRKIVYGLPIIYTSATPHPEGQQQLYHQFALSAWSPWKKYSSAYAWWKRYGLEEYTYVYSQRVKQYKQIEDPDELKKTYAHLMITKTRKELGFEFEPEDKLHYIELEEATRNSYNELMKKKILTFQDGNVVVGDTPMKLHTLLHQIEGGGIKVTRIDEVKKKKLTEPFVLSNTEKIDYIKNVWGDTEDMAIMYNYLSEGIKLRSHFTYAAILQGDTHAEGVDLSHIKHLIIYSQNFRTSKYIQRRARQANKYRTEPIIVHYLLVEGAISDQVYESVAIKKKNFTDSVFMAKEL